MKPVNTYLRLFILLFFVEDKRKVSDLPIALVDASVTADYS